MQPKVSVAIACVNGLPYIEECLRSFELQGEDISYEVIVADRCNSGCREAVRRHRNTTLIEVDSPGATIPQLRALAIRRAQGDLVAITEDHCAAPHGWLAAMVRAHEEGRSIVGGPIENAAGSRLVDWAVFFCEYSSFEPPLPRAPGPVPGNNTTYERTLFSLIGDLLDEGVWEEEFNARLAALGYATWMEPTAVMLHKKSFTIGEFMGQRYHYSRSYAGLRLRRAALWLRPVYAAFAATLLPPLLLARIVRNVWARAHHRRRLMLSLPLLSLFVIVGAWGESVGSLLGPGESLEKVQ